MLSIKQEKQHIPFLKSLVSPKWEWNPVNLTSKANALTTRPQSWLHPWASAAEGRGTVPPGFSNLVFLFIFSIF